MSGFSVPVFTWFYQGQVASGGSVYVYKTGTTTLQTIYSDGGLTTPITNPQILDANGQCKFYVDGTTNLRFDGYTVGGIATGALIESIDPIYPIASTSSSGSGIPWAVASGSADVIVATYNPVITTLTDGLLLSFRAFAANATTTPTFAPNGLTAHTITQLGGSALVAGNIAAILAEYIVRYNLANTRWELLNPSAAGSSSITANSVVANPTAGAAVPTAVALTTQQALGRLGGNIVGIPIGVGANSLVEFDASSKYPAADGSQITNVGVSVTVQTASASSTLPFTGLDFTTYWYEYEFEDIIISSNGSFTLNSSTNNGGAYATLGAWVAGVSSSIFVGENSSTIIGNANATIIAGGDTATPTNGRLIIDQASSSAQMDMRYMLNGYSAAGTTRGMKTGTTRTTTAAAIINAVQFVPSAGTFTSGKIIQRAIKKV